jgi:hypothetical protein
MANYADDDPPDERPVLPPSDSSNIDEWFMEQAGALPVPPAQDLPGGWVGRMPNTGRPMYLTQKELDARDMMEKSLPPELLKDMQQYETWKMQGQLLGKSQNIPTHGQAIDRQYPMPPSSDFRMYRHGPKDDADQDTVLPQYGNSAYVRTERVPPVEPINPRPNSPYQKVPLANEPAMRNWINREQGMDTGKTVEELIQKLMLQREGR